MKNSYRILLLPLFAFLFLSINLFTGCKKDIPQAPVQQTPAVEFHLTGFLDNEQISIQTNASYFTDVTDTNSAEAHHGNNGHSDSGDDDDDDDDDKSTLITGCEWHTTDNAGNTTTTGSVSMHKEVFRIYVTPFLSNQYWGMLEPGPYNFAYDNGSKSGAYVTLRDGNGIVWTSKGGQSGSSFQITSRGDNQQTFAKITGTVTCKMYDAAGNVKPFTGTFVAISGL